MGSIGTHAVNAALFNMPYDIAKDFTPITLVIEAEGLLVTPFGIARARAGLAASPVRSDPVDKSESRFVRTSLPSRWRYNPRPSA